MPIGSLILDTNHRGLLRPVVMKHTCIPKVLNSDIQSDWYTSVTMFMLLQSRNQQSGYQDGELTFITSTLFTTTQIIKAFISHLAHRMHSVYYFSVLFYDADSM
jgi:hypothetical protein